MNKIDVWEGDSKDMGKELFNEITALTGLPQELISNELVGILDRSGINAEQLTIDELRSAMLAYLNEVFLSDSKPGSET